MTVCYYIKAYELAGEYHEGQFYGEDPYFIHVKDVSDKCDHLYWGQVSEEELDKLQIVGLLHDIIEDTTMTDQGLLLEGFSPEIVTAVVAISKGEGQTKSGYYDQVARNPLALKVKIADTLCNLEMSYRSDDKRRIGKYTNQLVELHRRTQ